MTFEELWPDLRDTLWEGGPRYWRGKVWYRPLWRVVDLKLEPSRGYWPYGAPRYWTVYLERVDDNSSSQPPGFVWGLSLTNCLRGYQRPGVYPGSFTKVEPVQEKMF